ncbi:MAG: tRNA pseudouridine(38-40) synthase TruA, partial [Clostridiales bacterium]|nr:tRNA pseudouridine(38-40) synthase TruA [Clostridiales bacterium]
MKNIALRLSYDGSAYHGWQVQKNDVSIAETLEDALAKVCGHSLRVTGCGRTDAGVHALNYCANFKTDSRIPTERIPLAINTHLPMDISVQRAVEVPEDFNSILSCKRKEYVYKIHNSRIR